MLSAVAADDGLPVPHALLVSWELTSGDASKVKIDDATQLSTDVTFSGNGTYVLSISVNDGEFTTTESVTVVVGPVGTLDHQAAWMRLYPNPAKERITIEMDNMDLSSTMVSIIDLSGRIMYNRQAVNSRSEIDLSGLESGMYYVSVRSGDTLLNQKLYIVK